MKNKIFDGKFDNYSFKPGNKQERYSNEPCSIFEYDPDEVKVESLSLHERTKKNVRGNPRVVEGYGKVDYYKKLEQKKPPVVDNSNRIVDGDPDAIKYTTSNQKCGVMTSADIRYSNCPSTSSFNTAHETVMNGTPMVWKVSGSGVSPTAAAHTKSVNNTMLNVQENCDGVRAPQGFQQFTRNNEEQHNLTTSAIPFEPWNADKMGRAAGVEKFDPNQPYRPAKVNGMEMTMPAPAPVPQYKSFNRAARPFGC
jgi:hypothetical protein